jgi:Pao retrotransposon peptidase
MATSSKYLHTTARCSDSETGDTQIFHFSYASDLGYGAAIYIRTEDHHGNVATHLLCAKSRLAPTARTSTARLELCGAVILIHLMNRIEEALTFKPQRKFC